MNETEARLQQEIDALLAAAEKTDAEEDAQYGKDRHGDELPAELQRRESRLQKIGEAKAALEQEAKEKAAQQSAETEQKLVEREEEEQRTGKKKGGRKGVRHRSGNHAARRPSQYSSNCPLRWQHRRATMAFAPRTVQNMPDCLRREPITVLQPASMTPEPTNKCWRRNLG